MIAVDTNLLVYAHRKDAEFHPAASAAITTLAVGTAAWAIAWPCVTEFFSIVTHPRIYAPPSTTARAIDQLDAWFESPTLHLLAEGDDPWPRLRELLSQGRVTGPLAHDARVAALCLAHGVSELWTADRDFGRFPALKLRNPLIG